MYLIMLESTINMSITTEKIKKIIWGQCSARCCLCREKVIHAESSKVTSLVGEVAHIVGESEKAPRGVSELSTKERNEPENLLLLCRKHHKIVDDDPIAYPVEKLHQIKSDHIAWIETSLAKVQPWVSNLSQLTYINVPRLCEQAELQGYMVDLSRYRQNQALHSLGWELNNVMSAFQRVLPHLSINAVPIQTLTLHEGHIGTPISFDRHRFRTKNNRADLQAKTANLQSFTGDLSKDPHIYTKLGDFRLVFFINSDWITTSTAFTLFRPSSGQSTFSGIGCVKGIDYEARVMTATPWVIGLPKGLLVNIFESSASSASPVADQTPSLDALVDLDRAKREATYFVGAPEVCDLCRKKLGQDKYMIDGSLRDSGMWACMCSTCFAERGTKIAFGSGQLYMRDEQGWLEVAGFQPEDDIDPDFF